MKLVVATRNSGKLVEIKEQLHRLPLEVVGLDHYPQLGDIPETGHTFTENARQKARAVAAHTGELTLADDSGLEVFALGGLPGVHSARFAGEDATDSENNAKLLQMLQGVPDSERGAAFHCVMVLCRPDGSEQVFDGSLVGEILYHPQGDAGFGYDPLFWLADRQLTTAQLSLTDKNAISHRGQALQQLADFLAQEPHWIHGPQK